MEDTTIASLPQASNRHESILSEEPYQLTPPKELNRMDVDESVSNVIFVVQGKIGIEATHDKIIILLDPFRSGYECKDCGGSGIQSSCYCKTGVDRFGQVCKNCGGDIHSVSGKDCPSCRGIGSTIVLPESAKALPSSGRIVSCGPECKVHKIGERVLFGVHTGYHLPFKGNIRLRVMREYEPLSLIHAIEQDVAMGDFLVIEERL